MANVTVTWPVARGGTGACAPYSPEQGTTMSEPKKNEKKFFVSMQKASQLLVKERKQIVKQAKYRSILNKLYYVYFFSNKLNIQLLVLSH